MTSRSFPTSVLVALGVVLTAAPARAACDPTTDPDRSDVANGRAAVAANCDCAGATSHGAYVRCAIDQARLVLTNKGCTAAVKRCAARSTCGKPGAVTCCVTRSGSSKCSVKRDAAHCRAPTGGLACVGGYTSCCDACGAGGCATTTTVVTSTTTSTTVQGVCGDGIVNQPSEQCDGTSCGAGLSCVPPGDPNECTCCSGTMCLYGLGCCPGLHCVPNGGPGGLGTCTTATCSGVLMVCSPGGLPCCPGFACAPPNGIPGYPYDFCCAPPGGSCGNDQECCVGTCDAGVCSGGTGCCQSGPLCAEVYDFATDCPPSSHYPGQVCDGATGSCGPTRTGTGSCCQAGSGATQSCEEGPDATISAICTGLGYALFPGQRCLASGACAP